MTVETADKKIVLNFADWKIQTEERTRGRMKITLKLSKEEALAFKNFMDMIKPDEVTEDDFIKTVFRTGLQETERKMEEALTAFVEENKDDLASSGVDVDAILAAAGTIQDQDIGVKEPQLEPKTE